MNLEKGKQIHRIYGAVLSVLLLVLGVCLIVSCWQIYQSGDAPFTRESIGEQFSKIAIPVWISVAAIVIGAVLTLVFPIETPRLRGQKERCRDVEKMRERVDFSRCKPIVRQQVRVEHALRTMLCVEGVLISLASAMPFLAYLFKVSNFTEALNDSVKGAVLASIPFLAVTLIVTLLVQLFKSESLWWEMKLLKAAVAAGAVRRSESKVSAVQKECGRKLLIVRLVILAVAVTLIVLGILNGGMRDVLGKAIKICTECIGLG